MEKFLIISVDVNSEEVTVLNVVNSKEEVKKEMKKNFIETFDMNYSVEEIKEALCKLDNAPSFCFVNKHIKSEDNLLQQIDDLIEELETVDGAVADNVRELKEYFVDEVFNEASDYLVSLTNNTFTTFTTLEQ